VVWQTVEPHLEQLLFLQVGIVELLVLAQFLLELLVGNGQVVDNASEVLGAAAVGAHLAKAGAVWDGGVCVGILRVFGRCL
jgi:hypothetical protein